MERRARKEQIVHKQTVCDKYYEEGLDGVVSTRNRVLTCRRPSNPFELGKKEIQRFREPNEVEEHCSGTKRM